MSDRVASTSDRFIGTIVRVEKLCVVISSDVLRMSPFTSQDVAARRGIVFERRIRGRTDRPTGRIRFGERDRTAGARLRRPSSTVRNLATLKSRHRGKVSSIRRDEQTFSQIVVPIETLTTKNDRGAPGRILPPRRISRSPFRRMITFFVRQGPAFQSKENENSSLYGLTVGGVVESLRFIRLLAATVL